MCKILEDLKTLLLFQYSMYLHFLVQNWRIKGIFFSKPITTEPTLFTLKIPPPESWIHQEDKCGFISEKSWDFEDWFSLWLILWETDTDSHGSHFSVLTGYNKKIVLFISSFLQPQNILHIFSTEIVLRLRHNNKHFYRNILVDLRYYHLSLFLILSRLNLLSVFSLCLILLVRIDPITIIAFHVNTEIDQTRRAIVINMI